MAPYKLPRALVSLLMYQQPSSTTLYYSYLGMFVLIKVRPWNETGEITDITFLPPQRVSFVLRLRQSFPEDCARLKPEQCTSQPGGSEGNDDETKSEGFSGEELLPINDSGINHGFRHSIIRSIVNIIVMSRI